MRDRHSEYQPPDLDGPLTPRAHATRLPAERSRAADSAPSRLRSALAIAFEEYGAYANEFGLRHSAEMPVVFGKELRLAVCEFTRAERERGTLPEHVIVEVRRVADEVYDHRRAPDAFARIVERCVRWIVEEYYPTTPAGKQRARHRTD